MLLDVVGRAVNFERVALLAIVVRPREVDGARLIISATPSRMRSASLAFSTNGGSRAPLPSIVIKCARASIACVGVTRSVPARAPRTLKKPRARRRPP